MCIFDVRTKDEDDVRRRQSIARTAMIILTGALIASAFNAAITGTAPYPKGNSLSDKVISYVQKSYSS